MLKIYGVYRSRATRPLWLLEELGMPYDHVPVIQAYRLADPHNANAPLNTASAAFLAINPMGLVPAMDDGGFVLHESLAITLYLAKKYGSDLAPRDAREDAMMMQWALFAASSVEAPALSIQTCYGNNSEATVEGAAKIDTAVRTLARPFGVLDKHLHLNSYMVGNRFTAADIIMAEVVRYAQGHASLLSTYPHIKTWLEVCQARPAFKTVWERRLMEPA